MPLLALTWLLGCNCPVRDLDLWCRHDALEEGQEDLEADCEPPQYQPDYRCGDYDVVDDSGGFTGALHYFGAESKDHVATSWWDDILGQTCAGGQDAWYGQPISCEKTCYYDDHYAVMDIPPCPSTNP